MYKDYYHLQSEPFSTHPNTNTFFISDTHKDAWYYLLFGIDTHEPFLVLTGEYGMGKTLLCLRLMKVLKEKGTPWVEYIPTTNEGFGGILRRMASNMGITPIPEDEEILQEMIYDRFRADIKHRRFYLVIDDAHELDKTILTKLKFLSTFSHNEFFPIIMVFVGHPSFLQDMRSPALSSLNQRIKRRYHLAAFSFEDTKNYIYFRLLKAGATGIPAFPDETIQKIFQYSGGIPRLINNICDTCMLIGASNHLATITPATVDNAENLVHGTLSEAELEIINSGDPPPELEEPAVDCSEEIINADLNEQGSEHSTSANADEYEKAVPPSPTTFANVDEYEKAVPPSPPTFANVDEYEKAVPPPQGAVLIKKRTLINILWMSAAAILLILFGALLAKFFINYDKGLNISSPGSLTLSPKFPVQTNVTGSEIPALREEIANKSAPEKTSSSLPTDTNASWPVEREPSAAPKADFPVENSEPTAFFPFSLRSSSYQREELAFKELAEIRKIGLTPYLVKVDLGDMGSLWRIYIGFYANEEEAVKIKTNYKLANAVVQKTEFACLVGDYSNDSEILGVFDKLKKSGYFPYAIQKGRNHFQLYLGAYEGKTEAESLQERLQRNGIKTQVVKR